MSSRTLAAIAILSSGLSLALATTAWAAGSGASAEDPLSTDWLSAGPLLPGPAEAPTCRAGDPAARAASARTAVQIARIRGLLAAEAAASPQAPGEVVVLGNRGYNYGSQAVPDPSLVEFEAKHLSP